MLSRSLWQPFALLTPLTILAIWWSFRTQDGAANGPGTSFSNISKHGEGFEQIQDTIPKPAIAIRCKHAIGDWCLRALSSNLSTTSTPPTLGTRSCTAGCNGAGNCNADTGACDCPAGWKGEGCLQRDPRPCTNKYRSSGGQPSGQPVSWSEAVLGPRATGVCTGVCDDDIAACFCNGSHANPELPRTGKPARYPPALLGRYMGIQCQPTRADDGRPLPWGQHEPESLFGKDSGWCEAERPALRCECKLDGMAGNACELPVEQTCINQCSGRGACYLGFCKCFDGWYGHACHRQSGASSAAELDLTERPWVRRHLVKPETMAGQRKRPLVYIYDLPSEFNTRMHQYRINKHTCTWRLFNQYNNESYISSWTYGLEMAFHEALLQSKHHTLDPEQADFFYVPVYTSCFIHPVWGYVDHPWYYGPTQHCREEGGNTYCATGANRVMQAMFMLLEAKRWIERELPWWARKQGRDHFWLVTHDEGSCWVPAEIRNSIILSHWGRKDKGHRSNSAFAPWDNYTDEVVHPEWWPDGYQNYIDAENNACYDPKTAGPCGPSFEAPCGHWTLCAAWQSTAQHRYPSAVSGGCRCRAPAPLQPRHTPDAEHAGAGAELEGQAWDPHRQPGRDRGGLQPAAVQQPLLPGGPRRRILRSGRGCSAPWLSTCCDHG
ncbi:hypothetical protein CVIRNUC_004140 [Coccomyxa viridis]|uniref:EGF-like domain-containing protein n=1 Tax=Coccomyxa viridis TaxID=1274662 RepID=A0AAV1I4D3_9CHLO|nr:hypothetical protein CVIRNUC_004140 [Coccomyxa viridis]